MSPRLAASTRVYCCALIIDFCQLNFALPVAQTFFSVSARGNRINSYEFVQYLISPTSA